MSRSMRDAISMRSWVTISLLIVAFVLLHTVSHGEPIVPRQSLRSLPYRVGNWTAHDQPLAKEIVQAAGVSDYSSRIYMDGSDAPIQLYVGYYVNQRTGDTIHSPKNCLPGSGWEPIKSGHTVMPISDGQNITVNEYLIEKDQEKLLVFYWYQGRGRIVADEYEDKLWMVMDAISRNRTDGALVRVITGMDGGARARLIRFTQAIFPFLERVIPK